MLCSDVCYDSRMMHRTGDAQFVKGGNTADAFVLRKDELFPINGINPSDL